MRWLVLAAALALLPAASSAAPTALVDATPGWMGDLAFDSTHNRWLVVSQSGQISGRIMGNDAKPVTGVFTVGTADMTQGGSPLAAYSPDADAYLVVWAEHSKGSAIFGRFVSAAGAPGKQFAIGFSELGGTTVLSAGGDRTSALRYDGPRKRFVLVTEQRNPAVHSVLTTIDLEGVRGPLRELGGMADNGNWGPSVAVNEESGEYCAAYDQRNAQKWALSRVDATTLAAAETKTSITTVNVDISYNSRSKKYLLVYDLVTGEGARARLLNSCNANDVAKEFLLLSRQGSSSGAANPASNTYAGIGQDGPDYGNFYSVVDGDAKLLARANRFSPGRIGNFLPVIRANTNDGTFAATSSVNYETTRFVAGLGGPGDIVDTSTGPPAGEEPPLASTLGWRWLAPKGGERLTGVARLEGESSADVVSVDVLVDLKKVGSASRSSGHWVYPLDTKPYSGGSNVSAVVANAAGKTGRYTIHVDLAGSGTPTPTPTPAPSPAGKNGANVVSEVPPPATMRPGQTAAVSITVRNTGTSDWTAAYKLGAQSPADNANWRRGRVALGSAKVAPGAQHTFTFSITAPAKAGTYAYQWRMVQEKVEWFGRQSRLRNVVIRGN